MSITQGGVGTSGGASGSITDDTSGAGIISGAVSIASSSTSGETTSVPSFNPILEFFKRLRKNYQGVRTEKLRSLQEFERKTVLAFGGLLQPLKEGIEIVSPNSLSLERARSTGSEGTPHPKTSEELIKELTLSDEVLEQVVAQVGGTVVDATDIALLSPPVEEVRPEEETKTSEEEPKELVVSFSDFLQDSVVPLLKYFNGKREKYVVSKEARFYVQLVRNRTKLKRAIAVKREWDSATKLAREGAANLATECAAVKTTL
ncbi:hypothetical protein AXG93_2194s1000 [Marchantia polymorpha subsp. ruderalis]|uniref:Uncharacterized protein n=1 Tax=Marchantia polymorpha subsp. ruderalis TaxID=1480154 RepID=A0A176VX87_MARPO|nr:hypothetical protein AXG93_2194s1000 [Marchantia polymorpha subsp. ruderalis]